MHKQIKKISDVVKNSNYNIYATKSGVASNESFSRMSGGTKFHFMFENKQGQELVLVDKQTKEMFNINTQTINKVMGRNDSFPFAGKAF